MAYEVVIIPKTGRLRLSLLNVIQVGRAISAFKGLELYDGKLSRTVLRGRRAVRPLATRLTPTIQNKTRESI